MNQKERARGDKVVRSNAIFAALYDLMFTFAQRRGLANLRRELVARSCGVTLEIGAGTGLNLAYYPSHLKRLILSEPDANMAKRLRSKVKKTGRVVSVVEADARQLPLADNSIDTVVGTLVLCSVDDVGAVLAEVERVLVMGGRFLFIEHVRSENGILGWAQDWMVGPWSKLAGGCKCNLNSLASIRSCALKTEVVRNETMRGLTPLVRPLIVGSAIK